ncbi:MAG: hypothetical protein ACOYL8_04035 [Patescibacteria group bacterium]
MKKFSQLSTDQRRTRVIFIIAVIAGFCTMALYFNQNMEQGLKFDLSLIGASILIGVVTFVGVFFAIVVSLMQKDNRVL